MGDFDIKNEGQGTIFENKWLEPLTKTPAPISATIYIALTLGILYRGYSLDVVDSVAMGAGIFLGAVFFWTFFEYFFHRYINHLDDYFPESTLARKITFTLHGIHHEYPRDKERLLMPPVPGLIIVAILFGGYWLLLGNLVYVFMPGFMTGYLLYTYVHYSVHDQPVPSFLKSQYRHHALHHYKYPDKAFGVSTTLWDRVFRTMPPKQHS